MRRWIALSSLLLALGMAAAVWAGDTEKCTASTQDCLNTMAEKLRTAGWVGLELDTDKETGLMVVQRVIDGSPAKASGILPGDVLYMLNGVVLKDENKEALKQAKKDWKPGQMVTYTVKRDGSDRDVSLSLAPVPADVMAAWIGQHMLQHATIDMAGTKPAEK